MDLDFSLLTFSPSLVKKTSKFSTANKKFSKLTLKHRRLNAAADTKTTCSEKEKWTSNVKSGVQGKLPNVDFTVGDNVIQSCSAVYDKPIIKARVSKGKENRGIEPYYVDLMTSELGWQNPSYAKNDRKSCRRLSSDHCHENGSLRKKRSVEVVTNDRSSNATKNLRLTSRVDSSVLTGSKLSASSSSKSSMYFSCSQNVPKSTTLVISESSFSSVDQLCTKSKEDSKICAKSVIVISDSSSTSSVVTPNSTTKRQVKHSLCSRTRGQRRNNVQKDKITIVIDTSDSENDILEASRETPRRLNLNMRTPLSLGSKPQACSNTRTEELGNSCANIKSTPQTPLLNETKYKDIENWLSKIHSSRKHYDDADRICDNNNPSNNDVSNNSTKVDVSLNSSAQEILNKLYGKTWQTNNLVQKKTRTEACKKKCVKNVTKHILNSECKKKKTVKGRTSLSSSTDSERFENFLKDVRKDFESSRQKREKSKIEGPGFIDYDIEDNSFGFYQGAINKDLEKDSLFWKKKVGKSNYVQEKDARQQLHFSSSDNDTPTKESSSDDSFSQEVKIKNHQLDDSKKKKTKRTQKVIVSPVKRVVVKKTPKTVGQTKVKSRVSGHVKFCSPVLTFLESLSAGTPTRRCHPEAQYYKLNFKKKKEELSSKLFKLYNTKVFDNKLPSDMLLEWNIRMKRTAGFCYNRRTLKSPGTKIRTSRIELSTKVCDTPDRLRDTLIHELCHAATWIVDEIKDGHGPRWKAWARKAMRVFPELPTIKRCHDYKIQTKFTYRCTGCGYSIGRHSKSLNIATKRCGYCYGMFELLVNTRRKSGTIALEAPKKRSPVGFARFVKENYSSVKQSRTDLKHGDVMKLLGQQFSAVKIGCADRKQ